MEIPVVLTVCSFSAGGDLTLWCCPPLYAPHSAHTATRTLGISVRFACCARLPPSLLTLFVQSLHGPVIQELTGSVEGVESQSMDGGRESGNGLVAVTAWWPKPAEALLDFEVYFIFLLWSLNTYACEHPHIKIMLYKFPRWFLGNHLMRGRI